MTEIICLKAKAYFYKVEDEEGETKKLKGISRATLKKQIHFENALKVLNSQENHNIIKIMLLEIKNSKPTQ